MVYQGYTICVGYVEFRFCGQIWIGLGSRTVEVDQILCTNLHLITVEITTRDIQVAFWIARIQLWDNSEGYLLEFPRHRHPHYFRQTNDRWSSHYSEMVGIKYGS